MNTAVYMSTCVRTYVTCHIYVLAGYVIPLVSPAYYLNMFTLISHILLACFSFLFALFFIFFSVVPEELEQKYGRKGVSVKLVDNRDSEYVAPKKKREAFTGSGNRLGRLVDFLSKWSTSCFATLPFSSKLRISIFLNYFCVCTTVRLLHLQAALQRLHQQRPRRRRPLKFKLTTANR